MVSIDIPRLAHTEKEGVLEFKISGNQIDKLTLHIFEPPRQYENLLGGREYHEVMDIVARICGICPVSYQMSAAQAIESIFDIDVGLWTREMRRLFYCGEWLQSHSLHIHLLAAPDFLKFTSALDMAKEYPDEIKRGMRLQNLGNKIIQLFGAQSDFFVGACIGGFYHTPREEEVCTLLREIKSNVQNAIDLVRWVATLPLPKFSQDLIYVALRHQNEYPLNEGRLVSSRGHDISVGEFDHYFEAFQSPDSSALYCSLKGEPYLVGPLARFNLNFDHLPQEVQDLVEEVGLEVPSHNMFDSIIIRAIEIYYVILEAIRIMENYSEMHSSRVTEIEPKAGKGYGCTEAPRGICWHAYETDERGRVKSARIIPPTSQNQLSIEKDLRDSILEFGVNQNEDDIRSLSEMIIRNYDPCVSCSTHFLDLRITRAHHSKPRF